MKLDLVIYQQKLSNFRQNSKDRLQKVKKFIKVCNYIRFYRQKIKEGENCYDNFK